VACYWVQALVHDILSTNMRILSHWFKWQIKSVICIFDRVFGPNKGGILLSNNTFSQKIVNQYRKRNTWSNILKKRQRIIHQKKHGKLKMCNMDPMKTGSDYSWRWKWYDVLSSKNIRVIFSLWINISSWFLIQS